jgi:hypothetical protein
LGIRNDPRFDEYHEPDPYPPRRYENPTNAGLIGLIFAVVSLGLLGVVALLIWINHIENQQQPNPERTRLLVYWFSVLDIISFFVAIAAIVFASRALSPANPLYRKSAISALILGILELMLTAFVGLLLFCCGLIHEVNRQGGG